MVLRMARLYPEARVDLALVDENFARDKAAWDEEMGGPSPIKLSPGDATIGHLFGLDTPGPAANPVVLLTRLDEPQQTPPVGATVEISQGKKGEDPEGVPDDPLVTPGGKAPAATGTTEEVTPRKTAGPSHTKPTPKGRWTQSFHQEGTPTLDELADQEAELALDYKAAMEKLREKRLEAVRVQKQLEEAEAEKKRVEKEAEAERERIRELEAQERKKKEDEAEAQRVREAHGNKEKGR